MLVHNLTPQTTYQYGNCMFMSEAISFETVWVGWGSATETKHVIEARGRVIYVGQDDINPYRKWKLFWGQQATSHLLDLPYETHVRGWCEVCVGMFLREDQLNLITTPTIAAVNDSVNTSELVVFGAARVHFHHLPYVKKYMWDKKQVCMYTHNGLLTSFWGLTLYLLSK